MTQTRPYLSVFTYVSIQLVDIMRALRRGEAHRYMDALFFCSSIVHRAVNVTWLESPVQVSWMSQSFTASRHTTPLRSY